MNKGREWVSPKPAERAIPIAIQIPAPEEAEKVEAEAVEVALVVALEDVVDEDTVPDWRAVPNVHESTISSPSSFVNFSKCVPSPRPAVPQTVWL